MLGVREHFVEAGRDSFWSFCVDYQERSGTGGKPPEGPSKRGDVDYKEVLDPAQFALYTKLRTLRREIATAERVPVYALFNNDQLAAMVQGRAEQGRPGKMPAWGRAIEKYSERFLKLLNDHWDGADEVRGSSDGAGGRPENLREAFLQAAGQAGPL